MSSMPTTTMGDRIRQARQARGWTLEELATRAGLRARVVLHRLETRDADAQRARDMAEHAAQLGVSVELYLTTLAGGTWEGAAHRQQLRGTAVCLLAVAEALDVPVHELVLGTESKAALDPEVEGGEG